MPTPILVALIGVLGVVLGVALQAYRDRRVGEHALRAAKHLVENEIEVKLFALEALANNGKRYEPGLTDLAAQTQWEKHAEQLAGLSHESWDKVSQPYPPSRSWQ